MNQPLYTPGTIIAGKYKIERAIARGGCSIVYRGLHQEMGRQVALKLMAAEDGTDMSAWAERFRREARLASQLRHRNTITTFDYGAEGDLLYIAMEWVDGDSMRNVNKKEGAMEPLRVHAPSSGEVIVTSGLLLSKLMETTSWSVAVPPLPSSIVRSTVCTPTGKSAEPPTPVAIVWPFSLQT